MTYKKINETCFSSYVIVSDISCEPIEVTDTAISGVRVANIKIDGEDNELYVTREDLSAGVGLSDYYDKIQVDGKLEDLQLSNYYTKAEADVKFLSEHLPLDEYLRKDELQNYFRVVNVEPSEEEQAANPQVIWFVKRH